MHDPSNPWPDKPAIRPLRPPNLDDFDPDAPFRDFEPPSAPDIADQNTLMLRRQRLFRWAAHVIAASLSQLPEVDKVAAFGAVAQPLVKEIPRFREFRRHRIPVLHECADLDLAVWVSTLDTLKGLKKAMGRGLAIVQDTPYGGVAHHQVDVHVFDSGAGDYRGRLCIYGQCPKEGKRECLVPDCGEHAFLQQFADYRFHRARFEAEPKVILFERSSGFLVGLPPEMLSALFSRLG
jgi:hypothetical protein